MTSRCTLDCLLGRTPRRRAHFSTMSRASSQPMGSRSVDQGLGSKDISNNPARAAPPSQTSGPGLQKKRSSMIEMAEISKRLRHADVKPDPTAANCSSHQAAPTRPSPAPGMSSQGPPVPNGKPMSPFGDRSANVERSNPMVMGNGGQSVAQTVSSKDPKAAAAAASDMRNVVRRKLTGYVGFANLPNQWHRKSVRKGFNFNVMVVGKKRQWTYMLLRF